MKHQHATLRFVGAADTVTGFRYPVEAGGRHLLDKEPRMTHIIHGEPEASEALRVRIHLQPGWRARVHEHLDENSLGDPDEFR
jgi:hypothetical protein